MLALARQREIKPGFFKNEDLGETSPLARLFFIGLWLWADRDGRLQDRPKKLKADILGYDNCDGEELVQQLADMGFITRYVVNGERYLQVNNWHKHQKPHPKEAASIIPSIESNGISGEKQLPTEESNGISGESNLNSEEIPEETFTSKPIPSIPSIPSFEDTIVPTPVETTNPPELGSDGKKAPAKQYSFDEEHLELAQMLLDCILEHKPNFKEPKSLDQWSNTIRLMIEQDKRRPAAIASIIAWCQKDPFWQNNVLSADTLRKQFDRFEGLQSKAVKVLPDRQSQPKGKSAIEEAREKLLARGGGR